MLVCFFPSHEAAGVARRPAFPAPSCFEGFLDRIRAPSRPPEMRTLGCLAFDYERGAVIEVRLSCPRQTTARARRGPTPPTSLPSSCPPAGGDQERPGGAREDAMLIMNASHGRLMSRKEGRQLVRWKNKIEAGGNEQEDANQRKREFHAIVPV